MSISKLGDKTRTSKDDSTISIAQDKIPRSYDHRSTTSIHKCFPNVYTAPDRNKWSNDLTTVIPHSYPHNYDHEYTA